MSERTPTTKRVQDYIGEAERTAAAGDADASGYWLTQAWVEALAADLPIGDTLRERLIDLGRL